MQIVMRQISGLGNQLFQFAAGRYYATRYNASMRFAIDPPDKAFSHGHPRPFLLSQFCIDAEMPPITALEDMLFSARRSRRLPASLLKRVRKIQVYSEPIERRYTFIRDIALQPGIETLYLVGYWQAAKMVEAVAPRLRQDLQFRSEPTGENLEISTRIKDCGESVSLHVRRGDYTLAAEGNIALPLDYYRQAIELCRERLRDPTFFVFSDDIPFTRKSLPADIRAVFVDHNDQAAAHEDLRLMSLCQHHIIANSTFSWWGAWLNANLGKLVFAPRYWHLKPDSYYPELMPKDWHLLDHEGREPS